MQFNKLTPQEEQILLHQGTEAPFSGEYNDHKGQGIYTCKQCNQELFTSTAKFNSGTGWPSFDDAIAGAVSEVTDGNRTEIVCSQCKGHLGHVFRGERMTEKSTRHCVNSLSLGFTEG
jgi:methionine-R-sulfoxide reductase